MNKRSSHRVKRSECRDRPVRPLEDESHAAQRNDEIQNSDVDQLPEDITIEPETRAIDGMGEVLEEKGDSEDHQGDASPSQARVPIEEGQAPKQLVNTKGPTRREMEEHECTHIPYRSWCEQCVKGRGRKTPHRTRSQEDKEESLDKVTKIYMDFYYNGKEYGDDENEADPMDSPAMGRRQWHLGCSRARASPKEVQMTGSRRSWPKR